MKYAPGLMVGQLSGSTGSTTASHNRYGSYFRSRVIPVNTNTTPQQAVRAQFGSFSAAWRSLSGAERAGWDALAPSISRTDSLGNPITLTGHALYISVNQNRTTVGDAAIDYAPALDSPPVITAATISADSSATIDVTKTVTGGSATNNLIIRCTAPVSAGRKYTGRSEYKDITVVAGNAANPVNITTAYTAVFGSGWVTQAGMQIFVELVPVSENGFAGTPFGASAVII